MLRSLLPVKSSGLFVGRKKEIEQLRAACGARRHVLIVGPAGIGKTALLRHVRQHSPLLLCEETSSLRRICESLERELGWTHRNMNVIERKNRLLSYLARRNELVVFDGVALTPPRVAQFIARLAERIPVWIACRSTQPKEIGAVWEHLYRFDRLELAPFSLNETTALLEPTIGTGRLATLSKNHISQLHRLAKGNPRVLEEMLIELASREYQLENVFARKLLDLDRRIHNATAIASARSG
jgi:predicted ATPase